jgi:hypothetical protein
MSCLGKGLISALTLGAWLMMTKPSAGAMKCEDDSLSDVSGEGAILTTISGHIYHATRRIKLTQRCGSRQKTCSYATRLSSTRARR